MDSASRCLLYPCPRPLYTQACLLSSIPQQDEDNGRKRSYQGTDVNLRPAFKTAFDLFLYEVLIPVVLRPSISCAEGDDALHKLLQINVLGILNANIEF